MKNKLVKSENMNKNPKISVIGVGYVGLPLTVSLSRYFDVQGFDIGLERVRELQNGIKLSRRIALSQPKKPKIKEYKPDMSDFKTNATQSNSDLNLMKKTLTIDLPEVEYDMSPFYLILFVCLSLFLIKKFYL